MENNHFTLTDSYINQHIKEVILQKESTDPKIEKQLYNKFNNSTIQSIKKGEHLFSIDEFLYITRLLNINIDKFFDNVKKKIN